jgi:hypothetical protein
MRQLQFLPMLYYRPIAAIGRIIDEGTWLPGVILVAVAWSALILPDLVRQPASHPPQRPGAQRPVAQPPAATRPTPQSAETPESDADAPEVAQEKLPQQQMRGIMGTMRIHSMLATLTLPLVLLALCIVPGGILLAVLFESPGRFGVVLQRDYGSFLACASMSWAAVMWPVVVLDFIFPVQDHVPIFLIAQVVFGAYLVCIFRTLYGASWGRSVLMTALTPLSIVAGLMVWSVIGGVLPFLASPFVLYFLFISFRGNLGDITQGFRTRQNFKRMMEASTLNPHDADAQLQLGLIYQQRRQYTEAIARFEQAAKIDKMDADSRFQLGRIAREQGRLDDAVSHLENALAIDDKVSASEGWRDLGATHFAAGRYDAALAALQKFVGRREYEPEGLYWLGETLLKLSREAEAKECFQRCVESAKTMPSYRRGATRKWGNLAARRL